MAAAACPHFKQTVSRPRVPTWPLGIICHVQIGLGGVSSSPNGPQASLEMQLRIRTLAKRRRGVAGGPGGCEGTGCVIERP